MAKERELQDHERAHSGKTGAKVRHGADAVGRVGPRLDDHATRRAFATELLAGKQRYEQSLPKSNVVLPMEFLTNAVKKRIE